MVSTAPEEPTNEPKEDICERVILEIAQVPVTTTIVRSRANLYVFIHSAESHARWTPAIMLPFENALKFPPTLTGVQNWEEEKK